jgi:hypothetical protein
MATVPLSGTNIRLLTGVPFSNDYKNTRWFESISDQNTYFGNKPQTYSSSSHTFQRIEDQHVCKVNENIDSLWGTNYMMFQNTAYNPKWFYAFVTKLEYVTKGYTNVYFEIDVFQTWRFEMNFKPSFVVREHCPQWNDDGTPVMNTVDEGLHYGTDYQTVSVENYRPYDDLLFLVIVAKETMHNDADTTLKTVKATLNGTPQPLSYYIHPFRRQGTTPIVKVAGTNVGVSDIKKALKGMMNQENAVNNVVSIYVTEYFGKNIAYDGTNVDLDSFTFSYADIADNTNETVRTIYVKELAEYAVLTHDTGFKYSGYYEDTGESKLWQYPYTLTVLDDFKGNRIELKNEYINGANLKINVKGSLGTSNKVAYSVDEYNIDSDLSDDAKDYMRMEASLVNNSPNDISIINDYLSAYLQGNKNQIDQQKQAIVWNGLMNSLTGGLVGASASQHTFGVGSGRSRQIVTGANPIGVAGAVAQVANGAGQAVLEMQALQAKMNDIHNTPPSLVKLGGNSAFDYGNKYTGLYIIKKQITPEYRQRLADYFKMFGYKVNRVKTPNWHTRRYWNYVQTNNCTILGNMNNEDLQDLKRVFDNGITLWHTDDVGNYSLANEVI